jgi:hypothetical protein
MSLLPRRPPLEEIDDPRVREALQWMTDYFLVLDLIQSNFKFLKLTFTKAETNLLVPHRLGFTPLDIIQTSKTGAGSITYNYESFTPTNLSITTTGACVVRLFAGRFDEST